MRELKVAPTFPAATTSQRQSRRTFGWGSKQRITSSPLLAALSGRSVALTDEQALQLARDTLEKALDDQRYGNRRATYAKEELNQGVTIDLSNKHIKVLTDEIISTIHHDIERFAITHNGLTSIPPSISICTSLRYFNARNNAIAEFPLVLCQLPCLEILDLGSNRLKSVPDDVARMTSLKVFVLENNKIEELPSFLADMTMLQILKVEKNPLKAPFQAIVDSQTQSKRPPSDNSAIEMSVTKEIKRCLRERTRSASVRSSMSSSRSIHTDAGVIRHGSKNSRGGRFPVKVQESDDLFLIQPPSPFAGKLRRASSHRSATPPSPRSNPSNLETVSERRWSTDNPSLMRMASEPPVRQTKRATAKQNDNLGNSNHRGDTRMSPSEHSSPKPTSGEVLNALAIPSSATQSSSGVLGMARTIYLALHPLQKPVQSLGNLTNNNPTEQSGLQRMADNASGHLDDLGRQIHSHLAPTDHPIQGECDLGSLYRACTTVIGTYFNVCLHITKNADALVDRGDPRFIRNLMQLLYSTIMGLRAELRERLQSNQEDLNFTVRPVLSVQVPNTQPVAGSQSLPQQPADNNNPPSSTSQTSAHREREALAETHAALSRSCGLVLDVLPELNEDLDGIVKEAEEQRSGATAVHLLQSITTASSKVVHHAHVIEKCLVVEPRLDRHFRALCYDYITAWTEFGDAIRSTHPQIELTVETKKRFHQIQKSVKEVTGLTMSSVPKPSPSADSPNSVRSNSTLSTMSAPVTPMQATLGPAIQASLMCESSAWEEAPKTD